MKINLARIGSVVAIAMAAALPAHAASKSIKLTRHNLSNWSPYAMYVKGNTTQVCVFCHAPHNADSSEVPLWNHKDTTSTFSIKSSLYVKPMGGSNPNVAMDTQPKRTSKKCLSCHDGTVAIGAVTNTGNSGLTETLGGEPDNGTRVKPDGTMQGPNVIGTNLTSGHVISFRYDANLANYLNGAGAYNYVAFNNAVAPNDVKSMLDKMGYMQCHTCHDPHTDRCNDPNKTVGKDPLWRKDCESGTNKNITVCEVCHSASFDTYTTPKLGN